MNFPLYEVEVGDLIVFDTVNKEDTEVGYVQRIDEKTVHVLWKAKPGRQRPGFDSWRFDELSNAIKTGVYKLIKGKKNV